MKDKDNLLSQFFKSVFGVDFTVGAWKYSDGY
jgi:hypothetical protein